MQTAPAHMLVQPCRVRATALRAGQFQAEPIQGGAPVRRPLAMLAGTGGQTSRPVRQAYRAGCLVGVLTTGSTTRHAGDLATTQQQPFVQERLANHCGILPDIVRCR
jgi:hypothetical protein